MGVNIAFLLDCDLMGMRQSVNCEREREKKMNKGFRHLSTPQAASVSPSGPPRSGTLAHSFRA